MKVKYNIPFVVTSGGRLLTCSDLDSLQDGHNSMGHEFQQLKDSAFSGQDVEIRRGVIPIELDLEQLFTPLVVSPQTTGEDNPQNSAPKTSAKPATKSSASTCTEKEGATIYSTKGGEENEPLGGEDAPTSYNVLISLKAMAVLARQDPLTELERVSNDCRQVIIKNHWSIVDQFTTQDQALLVADLSNAKFDEKFECVIIPVKDLQYLDSL